MDSFSTDVECKEWVPGKRSEAGLLGKQNVISGNREIRVYKVSALLHKLVGLRADTYPYMKRLRVRVDFIV